jgi:Predicted nucleotidyltransferases
MRPSEILKKYWSEILGIAHKYESKGLYNIRVFGSIARGDDTEESDIDLMVDVKPEARPSLLVLIRMNNELEQLLGVKVDLITARSIPQRTRERVLNEAIKL